MSKIMVRNNEVLTAEVEPVVQAAWEEWLIEKNDEIDAVLRPFGLSVLDIAALPPLRQVVYEEG